MDLLLSHCLSQPQRGGVEQNALSLRVTPDIVALHEAVADEHVVCGAERVIVNHIRIVRAPVTQQTHPKMNDVAGHELSAATLSELHRPAQLKDAPEPLRRRGLHKGVERPRIEVEPQERPLPPAVCTDAELLNDVTHFKASIARHPIGQSV